MFWFDETRANDKDYVLKKVSYDWLSLLDASDEQKKRQGYRT